MKNPIKAYTDYIKHSIVPQPYSHQVKMNINIKQGEQYGTALIPCTIYAMDHSLDMNPALIRKKDKAVAQCFDPKRYKFTQDKTIDTFEVNQHNVVRYNPNNYVLELTEQEKAKGYRLTELERCKHCGQKLVVAELAQTRYKSCPSISVKLGDNAKEDLVVPVQFGVNKADITSIYWLTPIFYLTIILATAMLLGYDFATIAANWIVNVIPSIQIGQLGGDILAWILRILCLGFLWLFIMPMSIYRNYKMLQWYNKVKKDMTKVEYKKETDKWTQEV